MTRRKILSIFIAIATLALIILTPIGSFAAFDGDDVGATDIVYYGRGALASMEQGEAYLYAYDNIVKCVENCDRAASVDNGKYQLSRDEIIMVYDAYRRDHTEHFWLGNEYSWNTYSVFPSYIMEGEALATARLEFDNKVNEILAAVEIGTAEFDIELYLHDLLAERVTYFESENAHNAYGAIVEGQAVCEGYAEALQYLLQRAGICSFIITGSSTNPGSNESEGHAWCAVKIDGDFYHVDLTWNDQGKNLYHAYFNVTDEKIAVDHNIESTAYPLPVCNSTAKNYFVVKGGVFTEKNYTVNAVAQILKEGNLTASIFVGDSVSEFCKWYGENISAIAAAVGFTGEFRYGMNHLGGEAIISITPNHIHTPVFVPYKDATCTERGNIDYYLCQCGKMYDGENAMNELTEDDIYFDAYGHIYKARFQDNEHKRSEGNCHEKWSYWFACTTCGANAKEDAQNQDKFFYIEKYGEHDISDKLTTEAEKHFYPCKIEGCTYRDQEEACSGGEATCTRRAVCSECSEEYGALTEHVFDTSVFAYKNEIGHAYKCTNILCNATENLLPHRPGPEATATTPQLCLDCQYILVPATEHIEHTPRETWEYNETHHWKVCEGCEEVKFSEGEHRFENCSSKCVDCSAPLREENERHVFIPWEHNADEHWRSCLCGDKSERAEHKDENEDDSCDFCGRILIKSAYASIESLQGMIIFLEKMGILKLFDPLKQRLDTVLIEAGFSAGASATLSVTIILLGIGLILAVILLIGWLWLKAKIKSRKKKGKD